MRSPFAIPWRSIDAQTAPSRLRSLAVWGLWEWTGLRFLVGCLVPGWTPPGKTVKPVPGLLVVLGIYCLVYYSLLYQHQRKKSEIREEYRFIQLRLSSPAFRNGLEQIPGAQALAHPTQPRFHKPGSLLQSVTGIQVNDYSDHLRNLLVAWKDSLAGLNLSGASLENTDLSSANLAGISLRQANLHLSTAFDADLSRSDLSRIFAHGMVLDGSTLEESSLLLADLERSRLGRCNLIKVKAGGGNFVGANLSHAKAYYSDFSYCRFDDAVLFGTDFSGATLDDATFAKANLKDASFFNARLDRADLRESYFLRVEQICEARSAVGTLFREEFRQTVIQKCSEKLVRAKTKKRRNSIPTAPTGSPLRGA
ncbi:MAG: pentapeptide repeat-containing protein [Okeania sp. SIO1H5]|uniref:pentapeptide repeat-containing protein n=1 Tax=Okeania sp. SIO1H5 TaxID=2607777 RepID=UPI0013B7C9C6|nr:pentapeptide repeat-containing protein [Okeania sp. SIO1H5]NET23789.1 pentapeptide repeat-containing protein [Okeania sp. SIO1H5]